MEKYILEEIRSDITFDKCYADSTLSVEELLLIKKADLLFLPQENFREGINKCFHENIIEINDYFKEYSNGELLTEFCISEDEFQIMELHSEVVRFGIILIAEASFALFIGLITNYLYDLAKRRAKKNKEIKAEISIIIEKKGKSKKITYRGSAEDFEIAMKSIKNDHED